MKSICARRCQFATLWFGLLLLLQETTAAHLLTVALTGMPAIGHPTNAPFSQLGLDAGLGPVIGGNGDVVFAASVDALPGNNVGVWALRNNQLEKVVVSGDQTADLSPGIVHDSAILSPVVDDLGNIIVHTNLRGPGVSSSNDEAMWLVGRDGSRLIAREGDPVPDFADLRFGGGSVSYPLSAFSVEVINDGRVAYRAKAVDANGDSHWGVYSEGSNNSLTFVGLEGEAAPGTSSVFDSFVWPSINAAGQSAFVGRIASGEHGVWNHESSSVALVALEGNPAPGASGYYFDRIAATQLNNRGQVAIQGRMRSGSDASISAIWSGDPDTLELRAKAGDPAPGLTGASLTTVGSYSFNNSGELAFLGNLDGLGITDENSQGLWLATESEIELIVQKGSPAPGVSDGAVFGPLASTQSYFPGIALNNAGQLAVWATLAGAGVDESNDDGIWVQDRSGELRLVVREGDAIEVAPGEMLYVDSIFTWGWGADDGRRNSWNDSGELTFWARFTDGSEGIFLSRLGTLPEPRVGSFCLICVALMLRAHVHGNDRA